MELCCLAVQSQRIGSDDGTLTATGAALEGKEGKGDFTSMEQTLF